MSYTTTESDDAMQSSIHNESPAADIGNGCRSRWKGSVLKKGPWTTGEDEILIDYVKKHGEGNWNAVQKHTSLSRCGKSCRLRWANHLRPNLKKGAFSQEEEQLIVEMHSKMGNKWARMAEHLPGRTDNEIKNYWNTRIKRRQRAGLPLYPPGMHVEVMQWSEEYSENNIIGTDRGLQDYLPLGNCKTNVLFDGLNFSTSSMLPSASELSDIVGCNMLGTGATTSQYESFVQPPTMLSPKLLGDFGSRFPGCSSNIKHEYPSPEHFQNTALQRNPRSSSFSPCDVDPLYRNQHSSDMISDSHTISDGMLPTSKPSFGAVKLELPSFQYLPDSTFDQWKTTPSSPHSDLLDSVDAYIQSPPPSTLQDPDCLSSCDTGLLDMLLHEAKIKTSAKHSSDHSFDTTIQIKSEEFEDSLKNLAHSEIPSQDGISSGHVTKSEQLGQIYGPKRQQSWRGSTTVPDITRPDVLLASSTSWLDHGFGIVRDSSSMSDALAVLLGDEIGNSYMNMSVGTSSSGQGQAFGVGVGVGSCAWTNMPQICQMMELP